MKGINLALIFLFSLGTIQLSAAKPRETIAEEDGFLSLEGEIEDLLEEDSYSSSNLSLDTYDRFDELMSLEESNKPTQEKKTSAPPIKNQLQQFQVTEKKKEALSFPVEIDQILSEDEKLVAAIPSLDTMKEETAKSVHAIEINLRQVFAGSPLIYSVLFLLSVISVCVWLYSMLTIRSIEFLPPHMIKDLRTKLISNQFDEALDVCVKEKHFFCKMLASGILARKHGLTVMMETMKSEGKRSTIAFWQRISLLNEIAIIAPMLGLLGTVMGMFYAFYDLNRSVESISLLFDGLGISVGTTVGGLIVAILSMILHSLAKYRLVRILASVENEAQNFAALIDTRSPSYLEK